LVLRYVLVLLAALSYLQPVDTRLVPALLSG